VKLTDRALKIVRDPREISPDRDALIKEAALAPAIHHEVVEKYRGMPPSDEALKAYLTLDRGLKDGAVNEFISEFTATMAFAKMGATGTIQDMETAPAGNQPERQAHVPERVETDVRKALSEGDMSIGTVLQENEIKVLLDGDRLRITASVDRKGLRRLKRILEAHAALLEEDSSDLPPSAT
jgi:hypothetical protein